MSVWSIERFDAGCLTPDDNYIAAHFQALSARLYPKMRAP